jgi:hypothetical protein
MRQVSFEVSVLDHGTGLEYSQRLDTAMLEGKDLQVPALLNALIAEMRAKFDAIKAESYVPPK